MARKPKKELTPEQRERLKRIGYQPGKSGNPKGRPVEDEALKGNIRQKIPMLIDRLEDIALNGKNEASAVKAIETMLAYVLTKAVTKHEHKHEHEIPSLVDLLIEANSSRGLPPPNVIDGEVIEVKPPLPPGKDKGSQPEQ